MGFKWTSIFISIFVHQITLSNCAYNIGEINKTYEDYLKTKFGCVPPQNWDLIPLGKTSEIINNVCLEKHYQVNDPPERNQNTQVGVFFMDKRVIDVNEKEGSVTFDIKLITFWEDKRIKYKLENN